MIFSASQKKVMLWIFVSLCIMLTFNSSFWVNLKNMVSYEYVFNQYHAAPYGMLFLCLLFLFNKKKLLKEAMVYRGVKKEFAFVISGLALIAAAVSLPANQYFMILKPAFALTGAFAVVFDKASKYPLLTLAIYIVSTSFPVLVMLCAEDGYARSAVSTVKVITGLLGIPLTVDGCLISFLTSAGHSMTVAVTAACAGPYTMGVFLGIFALMYLDMPIPAKSAVIIFIFGVAGTWMQSIVRILILLEAGIRFGENVLWTAHFWTIYLLFPVWYLIFAMVYFRQARSERLSSVA